MGESAEKLSDVRRATETAIRIGLLAVIVVLCLQIVKAFVLPVLWGVIIAVAIHPLFKKLRSGLGDRPKTAATVFALIGLVLLLVPTWLFLESVTSGLISVGKELKEGTLTVPPPPESVGDWPVIGEKLSAAWTKAAEDTTAALVHAAPHLKAVGGWALSTVGGLVMGALGFAFSILLSAVFLATAESGGRVALSLGERLDGEKGRQLVVNSGATIRSVAQGVLGVAAIQAFLGGVGMLVAGVPGAGAWALLVLILAIIQLPPLLVLGPMIFFVFSTTPTFGAVLFAIWALLVSGSDAFLKPLLMGRGVKVPMLVILVGAIGGMLAWGILGLFVGAVVLMLGQQLFVAWLTDGESESGPAAEPEASPS